MRGHRGEEESEFHKREHAGGRRRVQVGNRERQYVNAEADYGE